MTKARQVDLGPMYMPVGEESPHVPEHGRVAGDAARFNNLMGDSRGRSATDDAAPASELSRHCDAVDERQMAAQHEQEGRSLPEQFEALWIEQSSPLRREVRVGWGNQILPGMALRMYEQGGMLGIEVHCGPSESTGWLVLRTPALVRDLSQRLRRRVRFAIYEADGTLSAHSSWPAEDAA